MRGQVILPVLLLVVATIIFAASFYLPEGAMRRTSPALYPRIVAFALGASTLWSLITELSAEEPSRGTDFVELVGLPPVEVADAPPATHLLARHPLATTLVASVLYPLIMPLVGFLAATIIYTFVLSFVLRTMTPGGVLGSLAVAVGLVAVTYAAFAWGLGANLPEGRFW